MKNRTLLAVVFLLSLGACALLSARFIIPILSAPENSVPEPPAETNENRKPKKTLRAFRSQQELSSFFRKLAAQQKKRELKPMMKNESVTVPQSTPSSTSSVKTTQSVTAGKGAADESITNVQTAGVDEGGIVKLHGRHLIILRRGRLFTVAIGDNSLQPISMVDAFAPNIDPEETWYDEMIVSGNTIAVIGYSYDRGGTEIGLFNIDEAGKLRYRSTYHLRSDDYYSSRNYASRLVGSQLVFYSPQSLWLDSENQAPKLPALRKWRKGVTDKEFQTITAPTRIYQPPRTVNSDYGLTLHTVTVCDLARTEFSCQATSVIGPEGRVFYVSEKSVYVWVSDWWDGTEEQKNSSMLYQMPLDGSAPTAVGVSGSPVDQFSFLESEDGFLNVLVRSEANGDGMWKAETTDGDTALLRVPPGSFSDGSQNIPASRYRELPAPEGYTFQNRFVGDYLLYGTGNSWGYQNKQTPSSFYAVRWTDGTVRKIPLEHSVDRIEPMGRDAVIVGTNGNDLYFSPLSLSDGARLQSSYKRQNATQGELRSHGFFYKPETANTGWLGLPIRKAGRPGFESLFEDSASILFLRNESLKFSELGELDSQPDKSTDDNCRASCVDWYGNARPLFIGGRVFALLGYEIVEGAITTGGIREKRRISYAPRMAKAMREN